MNYATLKAWHRRDRAGWSNDHSLRVHRSLSWLQAAEWQPQDPDLRFVCLWIAFNAAYATSYEGPDRPGDRAAFQRFVDRLVQHDRHGLLETLVWQEFAASIRGLLDNRHIHAAFWDHQAGLIDRAQWQQRFRASNRAAREALAGRHTAAIIRIVLSRIYTLRNQIMHGSATWGSNLNREQVRDCVRLMESLVPAVIRILIEAPAEEWGPVQFPVVSGAD